ncbi:ATP-dependent nuclease [Haloarcula sp. AONF1]
MEAKRIRVQNYRSIKDTEWVEIEPDITTLIGENESGKTSFLKAIEEFAHSGPVNRRDVRDFSIDRGPLTPIVSIEFEASGEILDTEEECRFSVTKYANYSHVVHSTEDGQDLPLNYVNVDYIHVLMSEIWSKLSDIDTNSLNKNMSSKYSELSSKINNLEPSKIENIDEFYNESKEFLGYSSDITNELDINSEIESLLSDLFDVLAKELLKAEAQSLINSNEIIEKLPDIIYLDDADTIETNAPISKIDSDEYDVFRDLLVDVAGVDLEEFKQKDEFEKIQTTNQIETEITGEVNNSWTQKQIKLDIDFNGSEFYLSIRDTELTGQGQVTRKPRRPEERSKGFQWFLSFYIKLNALDNARNKNVVMLLDDPAVYLHPEGKRDWLETIEKISGNNQIVYTSHSPYLIRKEYPSRIRLVEDQRGNGTKVLKNFEEHNGNALEPLREALGIGLGDSPFVSSRKILVEGASDYYILTAVLNRLNEDGEDIINMADTTILPTGGGDEMVWASKWATSEEFSYALLLDNDKKGKDVESRINDEATEVDQNRIFKLTKDDDGQNFYIEIEDMFPPEFYVECLNEAYSTEYDWYELIEIENNGESWQIEDEEYKGRKIASKIQEVFNKRDYGDIDKVVVANEIAERLNSDDDLPEGVLDHFLPVLGKIRSVL